jgi:hypothetical protein
MCVCVCVCERERERDAINVHASTCFACFHIKLHNFRTFCSFLTSNYAFDIIRYQTLLLDPLTLFLGSGARCWWRSWFRHWATSRKVAGSILHCVTGIYHWSNPFGRAMALRSTQPLTEMGGEGWRRPVRRADNLTTFMCRLSWNMGALTCWNPQALSKACTRIAFSLPLPLLKPLEGTVVPRTKNGLCLILRFRLAVPPFRKQFAVLCNVKSFSALPLFYILFVVSLFA